MGERVRESKDSSSQFLLRAQYLHRSLAYALPYSLYGGDVLRRGRGLWLLLVLLLQQQCRKDVRDGPGGDAVCAQSKSVHTCQDLYSFSNLKGMKIHASFKILKLPSLNLQRMRFLEQESFWGWEPKRICLQGIESFRSDYGTFEISGSLTIY